MHHLRFSELAQASYPICFLVPTIRKDEIQKAYLDPYAVDPDEVIVLDLHYSRTSKKTSMTEIKAYISEELMPVLNDMGVGYIAVADSDYFKALTKTVKVDVNLGYVLDCAFGPQKVVYVPNYRQIFYDPEKVVAKISQGVNALLEHRAGSYQKPGTGVVQFEVYPMTTEQIENCLEELLVMDKPLSIDIETFDLKPHKAGIGTISFAWSKHEGITFPVDNWGVSHGPQIRNEPVRVLLRSFFERFRQKAIYHNIAFDVSVLIYQLYMDDITDTKGLLKGMDVLLRDWDCTKLISYLATNSCSGNKLSLKDQAQEFAGNYAMGEDIKDITKIPLDKLLRYNLIDCLSTWYVREKHWDTLIQDDQHELYEGLFKATTTDIIQMQLTGLPVNMDQVKIIRATMEADQQAALKGLQASPIVQQFTDRLRQQYVDKRNAELKKKQITLRCIEVTRVEFNPGSSVQLQDLLYEQLGLPVIAFTDSKQPSTKVKVLKDLKNHTQDPEILSFLDLLVDLSSVAIILETFIPALEDAVPGKDGWHYLCGNFNLGGTVSGRLSSSNPNLQNLPANSVYAKLIKSCIEAPAGWILLGLDFASLEDRISALTTRDPQKLKVYTDGFDGHALRAVAYFGEHMPDIDPTSVASVNLLAEKVNGKPHKYAHHRQNSKAPTFLLTYGGTYMGLIANCGFTQELALEIERRYHELYKVSDAWVAAKLNQASKDGYVTAAFGLRVRTPLLAQVIRGNRATPHEAEAEGRTAGNALGQSWCLLNSRAWTQFLSGVRKSEYREDIRPCAQIHDAGYALVRDNVVVVAYTNKHLVDAVQWQNHPDIWHDEVKLGGEVSLFWPTWADEIVIPNGADADDILNQIQKRFSDDDCIAA